MVVEAPAAPPSAAEIFGSRLPVAERFVGHLTTTATAWGLIGPREVPRLWERHVLNCAVLTDLLPEGATVADVGSGAGLPGLTLAIRRPDLEVVLVEPLLRRATWLREVVTDLDLPTVRVERARAEELHGTLQVGYVTARAVAPLDRLAGWGLPLLVPDGTMLAMKGRSAVDEVAQTADAVRSAGGVAVEVLTLGEGLLDDPVTIVSVRVGGRSDPTASSHPPARGRRDRARRRGPIA